METGCWVVRLRLHCFCPGRGISRTGLDASRRLICRTERIRWRRHAQDCYWVPHLGRNPRLPANLCPRSHRGRDCCEFSALAHLWDHLRSYLRCVSAHDAVPRLGGHVPTGHNALAICIRSAAKRQLPSVWSVLSRPFACPVLQASCTSETTWLAWSRKQPERLGCQRPSLGPRPEKSLPRRCRRTFEVVVAKQIRTARWVIPPVPAEAAVASVEPASAAALPAWQPTPQPLRRLPRCRSSAATAST